MKARRWTDLLGHPIPSQNTSMRRAVPGSGWVVNHAALCRPARDQRIAVRQQQLAVRCQQLVVRARRDVRDLGLRPCLAVVLRADDLKPCVRRLDADAADDLAGWEDGEVGFGVRVARVGGERHLRVAAERAPAVGRPDDGGAPLGFTGPGAVQRQEDVAVGELHGRPVRGGKGVRGRAHGGVHPRRRVPGLASVPRPGNEDAVIRGRAVGVPGGLEVRDEEGSVGQRSDLRVAGIVRGLYDESRRAPGRAIIGGTW